MSKLQDLLKQKEELLKVIKNTKGYGRTFHYGDLERLNKEISKLKETDKLKEFESKISVLKKLIEKYSNKKVVLKEENEAYLVPLTTVMMSHLSDVQEVTSDKSTRNKINFVKYLLLKYVDTNRIEIDADKDYAEFIKKFPHFNV